MSERGSWIGRLIVAVVRGLVLAWLAVLILHLPLACAGLTDNYPPLQPELQPYANAGNVAVLLIALLLGILEGICSFRTKPDTSVATDSCTCGYKLTGNISGTCPECGTPVPEQEADATGEVPPTEKNEQG